MDVFDEPADWFAANNTCLGQGIDLVALETTAEKEAITGEFSDPSLKLINIVHPD